MTTPKKRYRTAKCLKCQKEIEATKTGVCFACRTSKCAGCGCTFTPTLGTHKPQKECYKCRRPDKRAKQVLSTLGFDMQEAASLQGEK